MNTLRPIIVALTATLAACAFYSAPNLDDEERRARVAGMFAEETGKFDIPIISIEDAKKEDVVIVDVRPTEERVVATIPGAISLEEYDATSEEYAGKKVVTYCTIGYRSGECAEEMRAEGIDAYNLEGSILGWIHAGEPVVDESGNEVKRVHVYGSRWNLAPSAYDTVH